jgi:hypothetical protein
VHGADGEAHELEDCPVTDGEFQSSFAKQLDPACPPESDEECQPRPANRWVYLDLRQQQSIDLVVARGGFMNCQLEVSSDGSNWQTIGSAGSRRLVIEVDSLSARYVRLRGERDGDDTVGLSELSVW